MADFNNYRSRRSETPSSSSSGGSHHSSPSQYYRVPTRSSGPSNLSYAPVKSVQYSYSAIHPDNQYGTSPSCGPYTSPSPPQFDDPAPGHGHPYCSSNPSTDVGVRNASYSGSVVPELSERASKRQRAATNPTHSQIQAQWADASAHSHHHPTNRRSEATGRASRKSVSSSSRSSGSPPGYYHGNPHDPSYGRRLSHSSSLTPGNGSRRFSSDDEYAEHGPTELPPRTYTGKSQYDPPKKPGKIPGSAMDYLPILEARFDRLETAIDKYVILRGEQALSNSILPGMDSSGPSHGGKESSSRYSRESTRR